jgi:CheY-like chemotaxis protein
MARVLVIDDDEESRTLIKAMLQGSGHYVMEASDGRDGLDQFAAKPAHVVITDINMPGMDGHAVIRTFRRDYPDIPIVAISGGGATPKEDLLLQASSLGAREIIVKPFEFRQLVAAVERALTRVLDP